MLYTGIIWNVSQNGTFQKSKLTALIQGFPWGKESTCNAADMVQSLGGEDPLEKEMATHPSILAWRIPWTEKARPVSEYPPPCAPGSGHTPILTCLVSLVNYFISPASVF